MRLEKISLNENFVSKFFKLRISFLFFLRLISSKVNPILGLKLVASFGFCMIKSASKNFLTSLQIVLFTQEDETTAGRTYKYVPIIPLVRITAEQTVPTNIFTPFFITILYHNKQTNRIKILLLCSHFHCRL